jgi:hypothetical protein
MAYVLVCSGLCVDYGFRAYSAWKLLLLAVVSMLKIVILASASGGHCSELVWILSVIFGREPYLLLLLGCHPVAVVQYTFTQNNTVI